MRKIYSFVFFLFVMTLAGQSNAQTAITTDSVIQLSTCAGGAVIVPFTVENPTFNLNNTFYAELSNGFGIFNDPDTIGSIQFTIGSFGLIFGQFPDDISFGPFYKVRVVGSDPKLVGTESPNTVIITSLPTLAEITVSPQGMVCEGTPVTLTAGAAFGFTPEYLWNTGETTRSITVTTPGSYSVTATALACDNTGDPATVDMYPKPATPMLTNDLSGTLQVLGTDPVYHWYADGALVYSGPANSLTPTVGGSYSVIAESDMGCESDRSNLIYFLGNSNTLPGNETPSITPGLDENYAVRVYPRPTQDQLHIEVDLLTEEKLFYIVYSAQGVVMAASDKEVLSGYYHRVVDMSKYPRGMYNLQFYVHGMLRSYMVEKM